MKKYLFAGLMLALLSSCDDGDLVYEDLDFDSSDIKECNNTILYKTGADQAFIINLPDVAAALPIQPTVAGTPLNITIGATNRLVYRHYNGTVSVNNICASIPPATPIVDDEWTALNGQMTVETVAIKTANGTDGFEGGEIINHLEHTIRIPNVTFQTSVGTQTYAPFPEDGTAYGVYAEGTFAHPQIPSPNSTLEICDGNLVFNRGSVSLFAVKLSTMLLDPTILNQEKTDYIGTDVLVIFRNYPTGVDLDLIDLATTDGCSDLFGAVSTQEWRGADGVQADLTGQVVVTTTNDVPGHVKHVIHLKNVTLKFGTFEFLLATDYLFGEIII
ncbi:hypothetical protein [Flavobacterium silvaticum]|uniref:Uncharacterized protein n=1 Tax=Flavobacterium silvaticum TaxID=1852020 RepID=A0A972FKD2_9FLAO|nr:hypothetical protein [Flavobacterium silvaticum]NMH27287.1 hypothetical protein [Flavobacterium silvaticum]